MRAQYFLWFIIGFSGSIIFLSVIALPLWAVAVGFAVTLGCAWLSPLIRLKVISFCFGCLCGIVRVAFPDPFIISGKFFDSVIAGLHTMSLRLNIVFQNIFPNPVSGFAQGIITGGQGVRFSREFSDALRTTSTMHLIAVSGYNVSLIARYMQQFLSWCTVPRKIIWVFALIGVWLFIVFVGAPSSAVRAGVMISFFVLAERFSRSGESWRVLLYALVLMLFQDPRAIFDLGFQLSFLATTGIIVSASSHREKSEGTVRSLVRETFWAQLMVFPVIAYHFGVVSVFGILANLILVPLMPFFMLVSVIPAIGGLIHITIGKIIAMASLPGLWLATKVIEWCGRLPYASIPVPRIGLIFLIMYYSIVAVYIVRTATTHQHHE